MKITLLRKSRKPNRWSLLEGIWNNRKEALEYAKRWPDLLKNKEIKTYPRDWLTPYQIKIGAIIINKLKR